MCYLVKLGAKNVRMRMQKHIEMVQDLVNEIEENIADEINVMGLAQTFGLSPWHFQRLFKALVGDSLGGYLRGRRLAVAAEMLLSTSLTFIEVAFRVGFNSHEAFTRSFKSYYKMTPKLFRKEQPKIILNKKPLLSEKLFDFIRIGDFKEPEIVELPEVTIVGFETEIPSPFVTPDIICDMIMLTWMELFERESEIENRVKFTYYGLTISPSGNYTEEKLRYIAGAPLTEVLSEFGEVPKGMTTYTLPKQKIAVFDTHSQIDADVFKQKVDYIYGYWLPNSKYARGEGSDYEFFENVVDFRTADFSSRYVMPVMDK